MQRTKNAGFQLWTEKQIFTRDLLITWTLAVGSLTLLATFSAAVAA